MTDNDGNDLSAEIAQVEDKCFVAFGAWTLSGYFKGVWKMKTGERKLDTSAVYSIVLSPDRLSELVAILRDFKKKAKQEAIYLELERDVDVRLI